MESYVLPSERSLPAGKFKNIELLRFLMAWAVVLFHLGDGEMFSPYGLSFLRTYTGGGARAVCYFYVIAFFFLVIKTRPDTSVWYFVRNRWLRMAPLIIVVTLLGFLACQMGFLYGKWFTSANLETILLIHDTMGWDRWVQVAGPAWFCSVVFMVSLVYFACVKSLPPKALPARVFILAFIGWGLLKFIVQFHDSRLVGLHDYSKAFLCLGVAYLVASICVSASNTNNHPSEKQRWEERPCRYPLLFTVMEVFFMGVFLCSLFVTQWYGLSTLLSVLSFAVLFYLFIRGGVHSLASWSKIGASGLDVMRSVSLSCTDWSYESSEPLFHRIKCGLRDILRS